MEERLQKILAKAGIGSRRAAERLITGGHVSVNGKIVSNLGVKADVEKDKIRIDGRLVGDYQPKIYVMLNKPKGFVTTLRDPQGRPTIADLIRDIDIRIFPVGRLDYDSEGLLLLTNDGDLSCFLQHPRNEIPRTYHVKVKGKPPSYTLVRLRKGVFLDGSITAPAKVRKIREGKRNTWLEMAVTEGRRRQIRRVCEAIGYPVLKLKRMGFGSLVLGSLSPGAYRYLNAKELRDLTANKDLKDICKRGTKSS